MAAHERSVQLFRLTFRPAPATGLILSHTYLGKQIAAAGLCQPTVLTVGSSVLLGFRNDFNRFIRKITRIEWGKRLKPLGAHRCRFPRLKPWAGGHPRSMTVDIVGWG